jgi:hypothetical protein
MYNRRMRYEFDIFDQMGGGYSKSPAKVAAARKNGRESKKEDKKGGRPPTRTLAERLLGRPLRTKAEREGFKEALEQLLQREQQELVRFFGVHDIHARVPVIRPLTAPTNKWRPPLKGRERERVLRPTVSVLHSKAWRQRTRRQPPEIRYLIRKLKLAASQFVPPATS